MAWINKQDLTKQINQNSPLSFWLMQTNLRQAIQNNAAFSLTLLKEGFQSVLKDETACLPSKASFLRQVLLLGNNTPLIYARVMIPEETYLNYKLELSQLGTAPIGDDFLYHRPHERSLFQYQWLTFKNPLFQKSQKHCESNLNPGCWARRSVFSLQQGQLLITEVFLPAIEQIKGIP